MKINFLDCLSLRRKSDFDWGPSNSVNLAICVRIDQVGTLCFAEIALDALSSSCTSRGMNTY